MVGTGIPVCDSFIEEYRKLQINHEIGYLVLGIHNQSIIDIEERGDPFEKKPGAEKKNQEVYETLIKRITSSSDPKFVIFDFWVDQRGTVGQKIIMISWCPDDCNPKVKMIHGASSEDFKKKVTGLTKYIHATTADELSHKSISEQLQSKS